VGNGKKARNCNPVAPSLHLPHSLTIQLALFREDLFLLISLTRVALQSGVGVTLALVHALLLCARTTPIRRSSFVFSGDSVVANCRKEWLSWVSSRLGHVFEKV